MVRQGHAGEEEGGGGRGRVGTKLSNSGAQAIGGGTLLSQDSLGSLKLSFESMAAGSGSIGSGSGGSNTSLCTRGGGSSASRALASARDCVRWSTWRPRVELAVCWWVRRAARSE